MLSTRPASGFSSEKNNAALPWKKDRIDVVLEFTEQFTTRDKSELHLRAGAGKEVIFASVDDVGITIVVGVNDHLYDPKKHMVISSAFCTTNCLAPVAKVLIDCFGIEKGL